MITTLRGKTVPSYSSSRRNSEKFIRIKTGSRATKVVSQSFSSVGPQLFSGSVGGGGEVRSEWQDIVVKRHDDIDLQHRPQHQSAPKNSCLYKTWRVILVSQQTNNCGPKSRILFNLELLQWLFVVAGCPHRTRLLAPHAP